ncbi:pentatricopeptide repeat-containing protein At5g11310, mitochondrial-like [Chenopodium quinoa]|uniref:pentatricopeptide repeat-containing protein At5g11310, mitochondrial-like n=1 Tax=Chenopodium quinoa TaxID=63459 RepID=UPI000B78B081|nr:pentatricopeptide repeat-containing protein At5g11310, mitochondrial-like [Chenopodium quinoa]
MSPFLIFLSPKLIRFISNSNPKIPNFTPKLPFNSSSFCNQAKFVIPRFQLLHSLSSPINPNPNFSESDSNTLCTILKNPNFLSISDFVNALQEAKIEPSSSLLLAIFKKFDSSLNRIFSAFKWLDSPPGYHISAPIFNSMVNILAKSGEFMWVLMIMMDKLKRGDGSELVSAENLGVLIRHYARLGKVLDAIHVFKFANTLEIDVFELLLNALCRHGHVRVASDLIDRKMCLDPSWVPSITVYNMLLKGWFRVQNIKQVERLWFRMRGEELVPEVVTYGIVVDGYCKMGNVDRALELVGEMRKDGVAPNKAVYGPLVDALAEAGRLKEALGVLERFLVLEAGPTFSTYNSLIRGFCKAGDLTGAGKILRMMISRDILPTAMTYNWFFRCYLKHGKVEEGLNLYRKMIESGYEPDGLTFHLLLKMLCEEERLELAMQIRKDMRSKGYVLDSDLSTMLIDSLCKMHRLEEAVVEFEELIQRGCVPKYLTYQNLHCELKKKGLHDMALKISELVATVRSSTTLPNEFGAVDTFHDRRKSIIQKAKAMSNVLKKCSDRGESANRGRSCKRSSVSKRRKIKKC